MKVFDKFVWSVFALALVSGAGASVAGAPPQHIVGQSEIQSRIDQQLGQAEADRQEIQGFLLRPAVQEIAGSVGLDLARASAAAAVLSGAELETLAAQARGLNASLAGGDTIVISATALVIILLILILVSQ